MDILNRLPSDVALDIFTRLPVESVLDCKLVSKTWKNLIQHPSFSKMHVRRLNQYVESGKLGFLALAHNQQLYYFEYIENQDVSIRRIKFTSPFDKYNAFGSFNGLICLTDLNESFCICNPMTKEYVILPKPEIGFGEGYWYGSCGFGYLPSTDEYKVVTLYYACASCHLGAIVYTLGSGNGWRKSDSTVKNIYDDAYNNYWRPGAFVNGSLYWRHDGRQDEKEMIVVFDLVNENFGEPLPPPSSLSGEYDTREIGVLGGQLFCTEIYYGYCSDETSYIIWLYEKRNDGNDRKEPYQSSDWTYKFALQGRPLAFTKSGDILSYNLRFLNIFDTEEGSSNELASFGKGFREVFLHKNTLLSLKQLGEKDAEVMEPGTVEEAETWWDSKSSYLNW